MIANRWRTWQWAVLYSILFMGVGVLLTIAVVVLYDIPAVHSMQLAWGIACD